MLNLKPSIWTAFFGGYDAKTAIEEIVAADFYACDFSNSHSKELIEQAERSGNSLRYFKEGLEFKKFAEENDLSIYQSHAYFRADLLEKTNFEYILKQIDLFIGLGVKNIVFHVTGDSEEDAKDFNRYQALIKACNTLSDQIEYTDTKLIIENLRTSRYVCTSDRILSFIKNLDHPERFGVCLDTGHLNLNPAMGFPAETPKHFIENTGNKLKALHINGNFGKSDDHLFPFNVKMANSPDWLEIMKALAESPYDGTFNFEVPGESFCPLPVKRKKLEYARWLVDYMQSPEFFSLPDYAGIHN